MTNSKSFVHLHNHADGSALDGLALVADLAPAAAALGMPAVAITDHGSMAATYDLHKAATKAGIKPIFGIEAYIAPGVPRDHRAPVRWNDGGEDDVSGGGAYTHMTLLAETNTGLHNLFRLSSLAYLEGFYKKPRMDNEILATYAEGVIATTGCPSGEIQTKLRMGDYAGARAAAAELSDIFGKNNLFVEIMDHGLSIERRVTADLLRLAKDLALPVVATNDTHYVKHTDAKVHEALLCVGSGSTLDDPKRFRFDSDTFYLRSAAEMRHLFDTEVPDACDNTLLIAERCTATFHEGGNLMPQFPVPDGHTESSWLAEEVTRGLARRYPNGVPGDRKAQAEYEISVINQMGFPGYFLVTADFIGWAKRNGIRVGPGRGSAAGSIVAYALGITELDPIEHGLLFERFLNPERVSMPDIDIDFDERRRGEVITYVTEKYGADKVAAISTFMTVKAKAAIKDAARVLGYPYGVGDKITKLFPPSIMGKDLALSGAFDPDNSRYDEAKEFRDLVASDANAGKIVELARGLEGVKRGHGQHAAGIIMSREPIIDHVPLMRRDPNSPVMTAFEYPTCESLGLLKMDFLGLSNLSTIDQAIKNIKRNRGVDVVLEELTLDDPKAFELLAAGDTLGVFQLDSGPIRSLLRQIEPTSFNDISATIALYRPGPMGVNAHIEYADRKNGRRPIIPIHRELAEPLEEILGDTYGLIVYQEQVMAVAQKVAGYSLGKADLLRKAMGKKDKAILKKEFGPFSEAAEANGYSAEAIKTLWEVLVPFADYAFNRAHSAAYGLISYWTAYLKANFPTEYMAALLTTNADDKNKTAIYLNECRHMGINVLVPDVNTSDTGYTPVGDDIRVGLVAIRNVGAAAVDNLLRARSTAPFGSVLDVLTRVEGLNKRAVESLVKAGAFDSFGHTRNALTLVIDAAVAEVQAARKRAATGQDSLFGGDDDGIALHIPAVEEWDKRTLLGFERDMLGLYVSDHPLKGLHLTRYATASVAALAETSPGTSVTVAGLITNVEKKVTRRGEPWARVVIEDLTGSVEVQVFPSSFASVSELLGADQLLAVTGRVEHRDDGTVTLLVSSAHAVDYQAATLDDTPVLITVDEGQLTEKSVMKVKAALEAHPGEVEVRMFIADKKQLLRLEAKVTPTKRLASSIREAFPVPVKVGRGFGPGGRPKH